MSKLKPNFIQERISELDSGILNILKDKIELTGFLSPERLHDYLNGINCFFSFGLYPNEIYNESVSKDDALFIVRENNVEIKRWQYQKIFESTVMLKIDGKFSNRAIKVRKEKYTDNYHFIAHLDNKTFDSLEKLNEYLLDIYEYKLLL